MANVFVHFEPIGPVGEDIKIDPDLPQYVIRGSEQEQVWRRENPNGYKIMESTYTTGSTSVHQAAIRGDAEAVRKLLEEKGHLVNARDINGWMPLHVSLFLS
jgi:prolyl 4-hydroxylase